LLQITDIPANTSSSSSGKRDIIFLEILGIGFEPSLREILQWVVPDLGITVGCPGGDGHDGVAGDVFAENGAAFGGCDAGHAGTGRGMESERFIETGFEVGEILDFFVGEDIFVRVDGIDFLAKFLENTGVLDE
jgi:hypothetical protein